MEIERLKSRLFAKAEFLLRRGHKDVKYIIPSLGPHSDTSLKELHDIEDTLDLLIQTSKDTN